jgi:hypothetical protein
MSCRSGPISRRLETATRRTQAFEISISNSWSVDHHSPRCGSACGRRRKPGERLTTCRALVCCVPRGIALSTRGNFGRPTIRSNWGAAGFQCRAAGVLLDGAASKNAQHVPYTPGGTRPSRVYCEGWSTAVNHRRVPAPLGHSGRPFCFTQKQTPAHLGGEKPGSRRCWPAPTGELAIEAARLERRCSP